MLSFAARNRRFEAAFSLVELAIVLVILGLLTGGVLSGQSLIRAAELRSVTNDYQRYSAAVRTFRDKYFALPGDMSNATRFWSTATACPGTGTAGGNTTAVVAATCNGNGDGQIAPSTNANENFRFWQQLSNAGIIEGGFLGVSYSTTATDLYTNTTDQYQNVPRSRMQQAGWMPFYLGTVGVSGVNATLRHPATSLGAAGTTEFFDGTWDHVFMFGTGDLTSASLGPVLKPEEAWNIDTKLDDGRPGIGLVSTPEQYGAAANGCTDTAINTGAAIAASSAYSLSNSAAICALIFKMGI